MAKCKPSARPAQQRYYNRVRVGTTPGTARKETGRKKTGRNTGKGALGKGQSAKPVPSTPPVPQININVHGNINIQSHLVLLPTTQQNMVQRATMPAKKQTAQKKPDCRATLRPTEGRGEDTDLDGRDSEESPQQFVLSQSPGVKIAYFSKK